MSKEIKLRLWKKSVKKYLDFVTVTMGSDGKLTGVASFSTLEPNLGKDDYTLEQYTGLKDKNGKEIYENDLIEEEINTGVSSIDGVYRYQVIWDEETLCWSLYPTYGALHKDLWETNQSREVIGNIHEPIDKSNQV